jgi:hypothetical protein
LLISWQLESGQVGAIRRRGDSGDQAGDARAIRVLALCDTLFVTAVRTNSSDLKLIAWRLENNDTLTRLGDSGDQAGAVSEISIAQVSPDASGNHRVVTSVRGGDGALIMISWSISTDGSRIGRLAFNYGQAGSADMIHSVVTSSGRLVTSMRANGAKLLLISWSVAEDGTITRLADSHGQVGRIFANSLMSLPRGVLSAVNGNDGPKLIAWEITPQGAIRRIAQSAASLRAANTLAARLS